MTDGHFRKGSAYGEKLNQSRCAISMHTGFDLVRFLRLAPPALAGDVLSGNKLDESKTSIRNELDEMKAAQEMDTQKNRKVMSVAVRIKILEQGLH